MLQAYRPALVIGALFLLFALVKDGPTNLVTGRHWAGWWDQARYYRSTIAFAHGDLSPGSHWYPLLYPLLALPALPILPRNPYLILDTLCVASIAQSLSRTGEHLGVGRRTALIVIPLTTFLYPPLMNSWAYPWTSTVSAALILWLIERVGAVWTAVDAVAPSARRLMSFGIVGGLVPLARPADATVVMVIALWLGLTLTRANQLGSRSVAAAVAGASIPLTMYAALHLAIYGPVASEYMRLSAEIGTNFDRLGWKATILFIDPRPWFPEGAGLLRYLPWLPIGLAGGTMILLRPKRSGEQLLAGCVLSAILCYAVTLAAYVDLLPSGLWHFANVHYFKWVFPLLGLFAVRFVRDFPAAPVTAIATLAMVTASTGFRFEAIPAGPEEPARRVDFPAPPGETADRIYLAPAVVVDAGRPLRNVMNVHEVLDGRIVRVLALRGSLGGSPRWYGAGYPGTFWHPGVVSTGPDAALSGRWPVAPIARWKPRLAWGVPCWIVRCANPR